ncbi:MAG: metallophosphoesterase [Myxococcaceae bacterium]|nr:metallophosphoesterase [Myxococcaceae bacterium]
MSPRRTIVIGDVHGCREELEALLAACEVSKDDEVVFVGDLVAKGPDSQGTVQLIRERGFHAVLGNHDAHVLRIRAGTLDKPPKETHAAVARRLTAADWAFLEACPLYRRLDPALGAIVVHAGFVPGVPFDRQERDAMINIRSLRPDGTWSRKIDDGVPWASKWPGPEHVIFGHDAIRGLQQHPHATGLDTGCVYGRELTALILPERRLVRVKAKRTYSDPGA